jgi:hypothetical protein
MVKVICSAKSSKQIELRLTHHWTINKWIVKFCHYNLFDRLHTISTYSMDTCVFVLEKRLYIN